MKKLIGTMIGGLALVALAAAQNPAVLEEGIRLLNANKIAEAKPIFEAYLKEHPGEAAAHHYVGRILFAEDQYEKAAEAFEKATALDPAKAEFWIWQGHARGRVAQTTSMLRKIGEAKKSKAAYEKAVAAEPANMDARLSLLDYCLQAPGIAGGGMDKAVAQAEEIRKIDPKTAREAFYRVYNQQKKLDLVEKEILEALAADPDSADWNYRLGLLVIERRDYDKAAEIYEGRMAKDPQDLRTWFQIGRIAAIAGKNLERGVECLKFYLTQDLKKDGLQPAEAAHWRLGMIRELQGDAAAAAAEYQEALKINPNFGSAKESLKKLNKK